MEKTTFEKRLEKEYLKYSNMIAESLSSACDYKMYNGTDLFLVYLYNTDGYNLRCCDDVLQYDPLFGFTAIHNIFTPICLIMPFDNLHKVIKEIAEQLQETIIYTVEFPDPYNKIDLGYIAYRINGKIGEYEPVSLEWLNEKLPSSKKMKYSYNRRVLLDEPPRFK